MRSALYLLLFGLLLAAPRLCQAQGPSHMQFSLGPTLTGTGIGIGGTAKFTPKFSASAEFNTAPFSPSLDLDDVEGVSYAVDLKVRGLSLMGHYHPFGGGFALGAGLLFGGYGLDGTGVPLGSVEIGDETYSAGELGTATAEFRLGGPAPVFELGRRGRGFNVGLGVILPVRASVDVAFTGPVTDDPAFQASLEQELGDIEDEIKIISALPFFRIGYQIGI